MAELFPKASALTLGYRPEQVDLFFAGAREAYERPGAPSDDMTTLDIRRAAFDLKRGGYQTAAVDAALDRLEAAFSSRSRDVYVRQHGQDAWMASLAERAQVLYPRLRRPEGERFARPEGFLAHGYDAVQVDALLARLTAFFDSGQPLTADDLRSAAFKRRGKSKAYDESVVDAYLARATDILLGVA